MANFGPSKTWTDGEILSHTDLNAALLDIINNVTNNNIDADNIDETDDYTWSGANSFTGGHSIKVLSNAASSIVTGTTLEWDPSDGGQMTDNSSGISLDFKLPDASDNQDIFASIAAICLDDTSTSEDGELSFRVATAGTNTEQMTLSSTALTVTPAITASGGVSGSVTSSNATITGGTITGITDLSIADGGTGASTASAARTNLGLGSIATQDANSVNITGGSLTGMTSYSGGSFSGTTGSFSGLITATGGVSGALTGNVTGNVTGDVTGDLTGNVTGNVTGNLTGDVTGNISGNVTGGTISGSTGAFSSTLAATGATTIGAGQAVNAKALLTLTSTTSAGYGGEIQFHKNSASTAEIGHESAVLGSGFSSDLFLASDGAIDFATGGTTQRMTILSDGKTGIGTASPNAPLAVASKASSYEGMELVTPSGDGSGVFQFGVHQSGTTFGRGIEFRRGGSDGFDTLSMAIDSSGNVGIGTSSPSYPLEVEAGTGVSGLMVGGTAGQVELQGDGQVYGYQKLDVTSAGLQIKGYSDGGGAKTEQAKVWLTQAATGSAGGEVKFFTNDGSTVSERARILSSGGITFNGDTSQNNALSDFEIGTWSPTILGSTTNPTVTYNTATGVYTKIGNIVYMAGFIYVTAGNLSGGAGTIQIGNIPYSVAAASLGGYQSLKLGYSRVNGVYIDDSNGQARLQPNSTTHLTVYGTNNSSWGSGIYELSFSGTMKIA